MLPRCLAVYLALVALAGSACESGPGAAAPPQLQPREKFDWTGEPISFAIPPAGWRREGDTSGVKGIRFVKEQSVGEGIGLGDYYILADRNRSPYLREILENFDSYDYGFAFDKALRKCYAYTDTPFTARETEIAEVVNSEVAQADTAWRTHDKDAARAHLETALARAERLRFSLADVIDRVEFKPEKRQEPDKYKITGRRETVIAGEPAVIVDYTVEVPERGRTYAAREAYVVHNSHLFICTFIGLQETLAVFDAIVASIEFPN
ncbi:MAG TPA: hypothetical protein VJN96_07775 [Vicinamibacterales bacterium]|nr:hypothetical protein [Vicinamibacterales bacterium]